MLVMTEVSVVRAIAGSGGLSISKRFTNSAAMCWASAAEPPLPTTMSFPPALKASAITSAESRSLEMFFLMKKRSLAFILSFTDFKTSSSSMDGPSRNFQGFSL
jgi:hypothetical protein